MSRADPGKLQIPALPTTRVSWCAASPLYGIHSTTGMHIILASKCGRVVANMIGMMVPFQMLLLSLGTSFFH
ncbi:unnamed protein product [Urochloa humidicola]